MPSHRISRREEDEHRTEVPANVRLQVLHALRDHRSVEEISDRLPVTRFVVRCILADLADGELLAITTGRRADAERG